MRVSFSNARAMVARIASGLLLSDTNPMIEANAPAPGTGGKASRNDHRHERLTATFSGALNAAGESGNIIFTRTFDKLPALDVMMIEAAEGEPVVFKVKKWLKADGTDWAAGSPYGGVVIKGYRLRALPATITLLTALVNFSISAGTTTGVAFTGLALQSSQP